jgi:hypothetical protein
VDAKKTARLTKAAKPAATYNELQCQDWDGRTCNGPHRRDCHGRQTVQSANRLLTDAVQVQRPIEGGISTRSVARRCRNHPHDGALFRRNGSNGKALAKCRAGNKPAENIVVDKEVLEIQLKADCFPFTSEGDMRLGPALVGPALGPAMLHLVTKPDAVVPKRLTCFSNACRAT